MTPDQGPISDRYEREQELGRGGMGVVWRGTDRLLERPVAIKEVHFPPTLDAPERDTIRERVLREARSAARLNHPSAVSVFDVVQEDGTAYIVMELVDAPTLSEIVKRDGPMSPAAAARIGAEILGALRAAHGEGIIHRDVKPGNVMVLAQGPAKLADFGIATVKDDPRLTASGTILGSPAFMAPEQGSTGIATTGSDLWGLGATLYFAVEGRPPFEKPTAVATLAAVLHDEVEFSGRAGALEPVIKRLLDKEPARRPEAAGLQDLLDEITAGAGEGAGVPVATTRELDGGTAPMDTRAETEPPIEPVTPPRRSTPRDRETASPPPFTSGRTSDRRAWMLLAAVLAALAIGAAFLFTGEDEPTERAEGGRGEASARDATDEDGGDEEAEDPATPEGWATYDDGSTGYSIDHPADWQLAPAARNDNQMDFRDPDSATYLRVEWQQPPADDPVAAWEAAEEGFAARYPDYERIRIEPTQYQGMEAALWEYTYSADGADLHAYNLGFITEDESYGFALNFQTRAQDWDDAQELWDAFTGSFSPP